MFRDAASLPGFFPNEAPACPAPGVCMDEEAFGVLYRSIAPALQGYIRKACGSAVQAEDFLQETFYRFLRARLPEMNPQQTKSYLFKIATSLLVDQWRREKREKFWQRVWGPPETVRDEQPGDAVQALSALKPAERALLWRADVAGFRHAESAATLDIREKSIRVLLFRARKNLARVLGRREGAQGAKS